MDMDKYQRERAYNTRQGQTFLQGDPIPGSREVVRANTVRMSEVGFVEAHDSEAVPINLSGRGQVFGPKHTVHEPDAFYMPSRQVYPANLDKYLRLMRAGDASKLRALDERVRKLQHERRLLLDAAYQRADVIDQPTLRAAIEKRRSDQKRGYPTNAVPQRVKGHRRPEVSSVK